MTIGRREFGIAGMSMAALAAMGSVGRAADDKHEGHGEMFDKCADACNDCQRQCDSCAHHCGMLLADGKQNHMKTMQSCLDCADVCAAAARIVARQGVLSNVICDSCIQACAKCAAACEVHPDDKHMAACAKECRACEKACKAMLQHA